MLADANVLLALAWPNHPQHRDAERWLLSLGKRRWATCAVVELGFVRLATFDAALKILYPDDVELVARG
ncbi:MAG: hypothetical protein A2138_17845 [Deltaproteobacteria bacterium RBG_16_71_12]|nr:MAG: hypothetical protein A2138_17845 [Deltaproteobacteria bacterium RBG_16_71_12]